MTGVKVAFADFSYGVLDSSCLDKSRFADTDFDTVLASHISAKERHLNIVNASVKLTKTQTTMAWGSPLLGRVEEIVDFNRGWRTESLAPWNYLQILVSLSVRGELDKHQEREPLDFDPDRSYDILCQELIDLIVAGHGKLSVEDLIRIRDHYQHPPGVLRSIHAIIAGLIALQEGTCDFKDFDLGRPSDPLYDRFAEARYHYERKTREADDLLPWTVLWLHTREPGLIPAGLMFSREMGVPFGEMLLGALKRIDADLFHSEDARLDGGKTFDCNLSATKVTFRSGLTGSGGLVREALAAEFSRIVQTGFLDSLLIGRARISNFGKGASLAKLKKTLANPESLVRTEVLLTGDIQIEEADLAAYRRRLESVHAWIKSFHPEIQAGAELVIVR